MAQSHLFYQIQDLKKKRNCPFNPAEARSEQSEAAGPEAVQSVQRVGRQRSYATLIARPTSSGIHLFPLQRDAPLPLPK
jgi:hypothetical protein